MVSVIHNELIPVSNVHYIGSEGMDLKFAIIFTLGIFCCISAAPSEFQAAQLKTPTPCLMVQPVTITSRLYNYSGPNAQAYVIHSLPYASKSEA